MDEGTSPRGITFGEQSRHRHLGHGRIGHVTSGVGHAHAHGFDHGVPTSRVKVVHLGHLIALHDVEGYERGQTLAIRGMLQDLHVAVVDADGRLPGGGVGCHILCSQVAVVGLDAGRDLFGDLTVIEGLGTPFGNGAEGAGQVGLAVDVAR